MAGNERFDDSIGRWLEETAPSRLPQRVLEATFERTRRTRQDPAWRAVLGRLHMPRFAPALGGAAVVVMAAVLALNFIPVFGPGGPPTPSSSATASPSISPRPSPSPGFSRFNSTTHGISIDYPSGWQVRPATEPWNHDAFTFDAPGVDVIFDPALQDDLYFSLASKPLGGQSVEDWCCSELWAAAEVCEGGGNFGRFTVDGAQAMARGCDGDGNRFEDQVVQVATATHGYLIYLHVGDDPILRATYTEAWFDAALETVELR
jgi:hypothetical protein